MTERVELAMLYPQHNGETPEAWTDRVLTHSRDHETNRQCSIGWHEECSDPNGEECMCICHAENSDYYSVEGHCEGGVVTVTRVEEGRVPMPPVPGEPPTAWADWLYAYSEDDAKVRATKMREAKRDAATV